MPPSPSFLPAPTRILLSNADRLVCDRFNVSNKEAGNPFKGIGCGYEACVGIYEGSPLLFSPLPPVGIGPYGVGNDRSLVDINPGSPIKELFRWGIPDKEIFDSARVCRGWISSAVDVGDRSSSKINE